LHHLQRRSSHRHIKFRTSIAPQSSSNFYSLEMPQHASGRGVSTCKSRQRVRVSFTVRGVGILYLLSCLMLLGDCLIQHPPMDSLDSIVDSIIINCWERIFHLTDFSPFSLRMIQVSSCNSINNLRSPPPWHSRWVLKLTCLLQWLLQHAMISTIDTPLCLSSSFIKPNVIINTGASVCISPHRSDFVCMQLAP